MNATRLLVKLANRDQPLAFGATAVAYGVVGLRITLWEPANELITRSVEIQPTGWEWYETQPEEQGGTLPPGRVENPHGH